jgi:hypothetical protein
MTFFDAGKTGKELEEAAMWDGGGRHGMHSDLSKAKADYAQRITTRKDASNTEDGGGGTSSGNGKVLPTSTSGAPAFLHTERRLAARAASNIGGASVLSFEQLAATNAAPVNDSLAETGKTGRELQAQAEWDGGNRRSMHGDLTLEKEAYEARTTTPATTAKGGRSDGKVLPTKPTPFALAHTAARAADRVSSGAVPSSEMALTECPVNNTLAETGKTQKQLEECAMWDGGIRRSMHSDLAKAKEDFELRPRDEQTGKVLPTPSRAPALTATNSHRAAVPSALLPNAPVHNLTYETGMTQKELETKRERDGGGRKEMHGDLAQARLEFEARPTSEAGVALPTKPSGSKGLGNLMMGMVLGGGGKKNRNKPRLRGEAVPSALLPNAPVHNLTYETGMTQKELETKRERDGGGRKEMHLDLTKAKEEFEFRPRDEQGSVLATSPKSFSLLFRSGDGGAGDGQMTCRTGAAVPSSEMALTECPVNNTLAETGKTQRELEAYREWDGGIRRQMHEDLTKVRANKKKKYSTTQLRANRQDRHHSRTMVVVRLVFLKRGNFMLLRKACPP